MCLSDFSMMIDIVFDCLNERWFFGVWEYFYRFLVSFAIKIAQKRCHRVNNIHPIDVILLKSYGTKPQNNAPAAYTAAAIMVPEMNPKIKFVPSSPNTIDMRMQATTRIMQSVNIMIVYFLLMKYSCKNRRHAENTSLILGFNLHMSF